MKTLTEIFSTVPRDVCKCNVSLNEHMFSDFNFIYVYYKCPKCNEWHHGCKILVLHSERVEEYREIGWNNIRDYIYSGRMKEMKYVNSAKIEANEYVNVHVREEPHRTTTLWYNSSRNKYIESHRYHKQ